MTVAQQQSDARGLKGHLVWSRHTEGKTLILTTLKSGVPNMRSWGMVAMPSSSCLVAAMMAVACFKYLNIHVRGVAQQEDDSSNPRTRRRRCGP